MSERDSLGASPKSAHGFDDVRRPSAGRRRRIAAFGVTLVVSAVLFIHLCDAVFGCGCGALWSRAAADCNVHHASGPHCPWCAHPGWGGAVAFFAVAAAQAAAVFSPAGLRTETRIVLALAALPVVGGGVGWLQGLLLGYWS